MSGRLKRILVATILVVVFSIAGAGWVLFSQAGALWLLRQLDGVGGVGLQVNQLEGRLADHLTLQGLKVDWGDGHLVFEALTLDWSPWQLLRGRLAVDRLHISGLDIWGDDEAEPTLVDTNLPENAASLELPASWPLPRWLEADVSSLQLLRFNYRTEKTSTVIADRIEAQLQLAGQQLQLTPAVYLSPYVELRGDLKWELREMQLDYRAEVALPEDLVDPEGLKAAGLATSAKGHLQVQGDWRAYRGTLKLEQGGTHLDGQVFGTLDGVWFRGLQGDWLQGTLEQGRLDLDWRKDFRLDWQVAALNLNPAATALETAGALSFNSFGSLRTPSDSPLVIEGEFDGLTGQLQGHPLSGQGGVRWGKELRVRDLRLQSEGLLLSAVGTLSERLDLQVQVKDLASWVDGASGEIAGDGWLQFTAGSWAGGGEASGKGLRWQGLQVGELRLSGDHPQADAELHLQLNASGIKEGEIEVSSVNAMLNGWPAEHQLEVHAESPDGSLQLTASGGWHDQEWRGTLEQFSTRLLAGEALTLQRPTGLRWSEKSWALAPLLLAGAGDESLRLAGHYQVQHRDGDISGDWRGLRLERFVSLLPEQTLQGLSSGSFSLQLQAGEATQLALVVDAVGELRHSSWDEALQRVHLDFDWQQRQMRLSAHASGSNGARLDVEGQAHQPLGLKVPEQGDLHFSATGLQLASLGVWLPEALLLQGEMACEGDGRWLGDGRFRLQGEVSSSGGELSWHDSKGALRSQLEQVRVGFDWQDQSLELQSHLVLGRQGTLKGDATLPVAARWPLDLDQDASLVGQLQGTLGETGLIEALIPLPIEELSGQLKVDLSLAGSLRHPLLRGDVSLQEAGAYLPQLGISLRPIEAQVRLADGKLKLEQLRLVSGESVLSGRGGLEFGGWDNFSYHLELQGENFKAVDLAELTVDLSPDLSFSGGPERMLVQGRVLIPHLELRGVRTVPEVAASPDVRIVGNELDADKKKLDWQPEVQVQVILGDQVSLVASGMNARLAGAADISLATGGVPQANGEVRIAEGDFAAYGVRLKIRHGLLSYRNAALDNPALDILAMRDLGQLQAGVQVGGTALRPQVVLHSRPAMPEKDILLAILTGRQADSAGGDSGMLMLGTGALLAPGESIFSKIGLTNIDIQGLFSGDGGLRLRHRLAERWEVESVLGINSGVDLFYVVEFQ